jgi:hypothetical protein
MGIAPRNIKAMLGGGSAGATFAICFLIATRSQASDLPLEARQNPFRLCKSAVVGYFEMFILAVSTGVHPWFLLSVAQGFHAGNL